jgi:uncharacterized protein
MRTIEAIAQRLTPQSEFFAIVSICLGYPTLTSLWVMSHGEKLSTLSFTTSKFLVLIAFEVISLSLAACLLFCRGWTWEKLNFEVSWKLTGAGLLLLAIYYGGYPCVFYMVGELTGTTQSLLEASSRFTTDAASLVILAGSAINAVFEETVAVGYVVRALEKQGALFAIIISTFLRFVYHTYQGPIAVVSILPLGALFAFVYWHWGRLWPLVFAHFMADIFAFAGTRG